MVYLSWYLLLIEEVTEALIDMELPERGAEVTVEVDNTMMMYIRSTVKVVLVSSLFMFVDLQTSMHHK